MTPNGFHVGAIIPVDAFDGAQLAVELLSSQSVDTGSSAMILKGTMWLHDGGTMAVALKVFPSVLSEVKREMFHRELLAARSLRHRAILPFIGTALVGLHTILVAQFMANGNMLRYLRQHQDVARRPLIIQVARAVHFLHVWAGVVHGDLKCENILISDDGRALLADFGLSTLVEKAESSTTTATGLRQQNTIRFAAPELLLGDADDAPKTRQRSKSTKSDVYAFGMLIVQTFTGKEPWYGCSLQAVMRNVCLGEIHPRPGAEATERGLTDSWWSICLSSWEFRPEARPTMANVWDRLTEGDLMLSPIHPASSVRLATGSGLIRSVTFTPDGAQLVWCTDQGELFRASSSTSSPSKSRIAKYHKALTCVALSADGRRAYTGAMDQTLQIWDTATGAMLCAPRTGHMSYITALAHCPALGKLVSASCDETLRIWPDSPLASAAESVALVGHAGRVRAVAFSPDGQRIASGAEDRTVRLWSALGFALMPPLLGHDGDVLSVAFATDARTVVSGAMDRTVRLWSALTGESLRVLMGHRDYITAVAFSPAGRYVASAAWDGTLRLWDAEGGSCVGAPIAGSRRDASLASVAFSPDGRHLAAGGSQGEVRLWRDRFVRTRE